MSCLYSPPGKSQVETREKDFFFRNGGRSRSGNGGGGTRPSTLRDEFALYDVRTEVCDGAVCGRSELRRSLNDGALGGSAGISGMGSIPMGMSVRVSIDLDPTKTPTWLSIRSRRPAANVNTLSLNNVLDLLLQLIPLQHSSRNPFNKVIHHGT